MTNDEVIESLINVKAHIALVPMSEYGTIRMKRKDLDAIDQAIKWKDEIEELKNKINWLCEEADIIEKERDKFNQQVEALREEREHWKNGYEQMQDSFNNAYRDMVSAKEKLNRIESAEMPEKKTELGAYGEFGYNEAINDCTPYVQKLKKELDNLKEQVKLERLDEDELKAIIAKNTYFKHGLPYFDGCAKAICSKFGTTKTESEGLDMNDKLKPCPFCGGEAMIDDTQRFYWIICHKCGMQFGDYYNREDLIEDWNTRTTKCRKMDCGKQAVWCDEHSSPDDLVERIEKVIEKNNRTPLEQRAIGAHDLATAIAKELQ